MSRITSHLACLPFPSHSRPLLGPPTLRLPLCLYRRRTWTPTPASIHPPSIIPSGYSQTTASHPVLSYPHLADLPSLALPILSSSTSFTPHLLLSFLSHLDTRAHRIGRQITRDPHTGDTTYLGSRASTLVIIQTRHTPYPPPICTPCRPSRPPSRPSRRSPSSLRPSPTHTPTPRNNGHNGIEILRARPAQNVRPPPTRHRQRRRPARASTPTRSWAGSRSWATREYLRR